MSCDDISRYSVSSQSGSKGSEAVSYYLDQDSGQYFSLLEGDGPPGSDYDRGRNTGVRRRDKTPTHGKMETAISCRAGMGPWTCACVEVQHVFSHQCSHLFILTFSSLCVHHSLHGSASSCLYLGYTRPKNTDHMTKGQSKNTVFSSLSASPPVRPPSPHHSFQDS